MTTPISQAFHLPQPEAIRAMGFVVKLRELDAASPAVNQLVDDYVLTPAVEKELPRILDDMKGIFDRGEEYGRFIHGSFGSGKSHFMTMLSLLLEGAAPAWTKCRPLFDAHHAEQLRKNPAASAAAPQHEAWLQKANLLVVRIHMLSVRGKTTSLDRAIYEGFNDALKRRGKRTFEFLDLSAIFDEVRREAKDYGDLLWKRLENAGIVAGEADFEAIAKSSQKQREAFARAFLAYKGRDVATAGLDPRWSEGLRRMGEHAKAEGFGGIVLMLDEFLLWLGEKSGQEFVQEINNLNVIVDHNTGQRPLPIFVFVARQRNLQEFFPDLVDETKIHEQLDHHAKRFEVTKLQDVELRHIVKGRVLRPRLPKEVQTAVDSLAVTHQKLLPALLADGDIGYLTDVYPFHPALIEMLVDVTSLMQRERSALRLLYELLVVHYPDLPLGQLMPVGSAFAALFPESGVEASKKVDLMQDIHHQYYARLLPAMRQMVEEGGADFSDERRKALDQLVKTVLLSAVSPRLKHQGLTIERLVQLNSVDVEGETFRSQTRMAETDLLSLSQRVPDLQIAGQGKTAMVSFVLGRVSLGEVLTRARSKVDSNAQRFHVFWRSLKQALGLTGEKGFEEGGPNEGDWDLLWRRTRRRGRLKLGNVREMSYDDFVPPEGTFKILVDYPWDEPGHTVDEDRMKATNVRKTKGGVHTSCWLPRHMTPSELAVVTDLAAVRYLVSQAGQEELLATYALPDKAKIIDHAEVRRKNLEGQLEGIIKDVYIVHGELFSIISDVDNSRPHETMEQNLKHIASLLMDRRYPQHPNFEAEPKKQELELLLAWMVDAGDVGTSVAYDDATGKALKTLGQPLELVDIGQTKASLRADSRYLKAVLAKVDQANVRWSPIAEHLRDTYGLQPLVIDLFLGFVCQRNHRALLEPDLQPTEVRIGMPASHVLRLQQGSVASLPDWSRLRDLGHALLGVPRPPVQRSLRAQDRFASEMRTAAEATRLVLQGVHERLVGLEAAGSARANEIAAANAALAPLVAKTTDSYEALSKFLAAWPEEGMEGTRAVVQKAVAIREALGGIDDSARSNLAAGAGHSVAGDDARAHLATLQDVVASTQAERPLTADWTKAWSATARQLVQKLLVQPVAPVAAKAHTPTPSGGAESAGVQRSDTEHRAEPAAAPAERVALLEQIVDTSDPDAVSDFLGAVRKALQAGASGLRRLVLLAEDGGREE